MTTNKTKFGLTLGFTAVLGLMALLVLLAVFRMGEIHQRLETIVEDHNRKKALVSTMYNLARERIVSLQKMVTLQDPFARDEEWLAFNRLAARFSEARDELQAMPLTERERELVQLQGDYTSIARPLHERAVEMLKNGREQTATDLLLTEGIPAQQDVLDQLRALADHQDEASHAALREASRAYRNTRMLLFAGGGTALFIGIIIAFGAVRRAVFSETTLSREKERVQTTLQSIGDGIITTDAFGRIEFMNPVAEEMTGINRHDAHGRPVDRIFHIVDDATGKPVENPVRDALNNQTILCSAVHTTLIRSDGTEFAIEHTVAPIKGRDDMPASGAVVIFRDVTEMRKLSRQLTYQAAHDALTGLINRREFETRLEQALITARTEGRHHALCYLDLDQFKLVNDTCGHTAGDELLKQLSERIRGCVRESDVLARLGGDEFGVLLEGCPLERAWQIAEELRRSIRGYRFIWDNQSFEIGVSIGLVPLTADAGDMAAVLSAADAACYVAKDQGRNRIHTYHPKDEALERHHGEMEWAQRITLALEEDRFALDYQPIAHIGGGRSVQLYEVLVRMVAADGTMVPPMAFIPAAERYNFMPEIDRWVVSRVFRCLSEARVRNARDWRLSINLSGQSLCDAQFLDFVTDALDQSRIAPEQVCFEITETAAIANLARATDFINTLRRRGCHFALDDFGSGLSSFAYLKNLNVDYLKIDGGFIRDMLTDPMDRAFVESINQIGHIMGLETIAEFVENEATVTELREMGVDYAQGYHIGHPAPLTGFHEAEHPHPDLPLRPVLSPSTS